MATTAYRDHREELPHRPVTDSVAGSAAQRAADDELGFTRNVLLTGYWPPTNVMLRPFNTDPAINPDGWQGENWRGLGFDLHAFFPEFPDRPHPHARPRLSEPWGVGDFRVDYQSTSRDWARVTDELRPVCIITFSYDGRDDGRVWKIEGFAENHARWTPDLEPPEQPTPSPPDPTAGAGTRRYSNLPAAEIIDACRRLEPPADGIAPTTFREERFGPGRYLSEYIAYLGMWYRDRHDHCRERHRCVTAGHIHVDTGVRFVDGIALENVETATRWLEATLVATLVHLPLRLVDCVGTLAICRVHLGERPPLSLRHDVLDQSVSDGGSLRRALAEIIRAGPA